MYISFVQTLDTGGHIKIEELLIENGGELKSIGICDEFIVGYRTTVTESEGDDELFVVSTRKALENELPPIIAMIAWGIFLYRRGLC